MRDIYTFVEHPGEAEYRFSLFSEAAQCMFTSLPRLRRSLASAGAQTPGKDVIFVIMEDGVIYITFDQTNEA